MDNHCQYSPKGNKSMSDKAEGAVADAGATVQKKLNQAGEAQDQLVQFIQDNPISAALVFIGIGYVLGKIIWGYATLILLGVNLVLAAISAYWPRDRRRAAPSARRST
jgi:hypothetical protein